MNASASKPARETRGRAHVTVLMYHHVGRFDPPRNRQGLFCDVDRFAAQMRYLQRSRYAVISLGQAYDGLFGNGQLPPRSVVLTFDDGYQDFHDYAWPVLHKHGFPATVFMVAGRIGQHADWLEPEAAISTELMDADALRRVADDGVTVGAHGYSHCRMEALEASTLRRETEESRACLEDAIGRPVRHFCYPYGSHDDAAVAAVRNAGYVTGLITRRDRADRAAGAYEIPRQGISYRDGYVSFAYKLGLKHMRPQFKSRS